MGNSKSTTTTTYIGIGDTPKHACKNLEHSLRQDFDTATVTLGPMDETSPLSPRTRNISRNVECIVNGTAFQARMAKSNLRNAIQFKVHVVITHLA